MVNPPVIAGPVSRGTAARSTVMAGADQAFNTWFAAPSEGADQSGGNILMGVPSETASR
jgi:hypothetical protein